MAGDGRNSPSKSVTKRQIGSFPLSEAEKSVFVEELAAHGNKRQAARMARPHTKFAATDLFNKHRKLDPDFDSACEDALEQFKDPILREVYRRGVDGEVGFVYQGGKQVFNKDESPAMTRVVSDKILERMMIGRRWFGDDFVEKRSQDITVTHNETPQLLISEYDALKLSGDGKRALMTVLKELQMIRQEDDNGGLLALESNVTEGEYELIEPEPWELWEGDDD